MRLTMRRAGLVVSAALVVALPGCDTSSSPKQQPSTPPSSGYVPAAFKAACGHPGSRVQLTAKDLPVTVAHAACDLTGVIVATEQGSDQVPGGTVPPESSCNSSSGCPSVHLSPKTKDVTITAG